MRDAVAILDHLKIDAAHIVGLSMGGYTTLQVALNHPKRVRSMTLAGTGSGSERAYTEVFHKNVRDLALVFEREGSAAVAATYGNGPGRVPFLVKDARGFAEFDGLSGRARSARLGAHVARTSRGASLALRLRSEIRNLKTPTLIVVGDEDDRCIEPNGLLKADRHGVRALWCCRRPAMGEPGGAALFNQVVGDLSPASKPGAGLRAIRARFRRRRRSATGTGASAKLILDAAKPCAGASRC